MPLPLKSSKTRPLISPIILSVVEPPDKSVIGNAPPTVRDAAGNNRAGGGGADRVSDTNGSVTATGDAFAGSVRARAMKTAVFRSGVGTNSGAAGTPDTADTAVAPDITPPWDGASRAATGRA